MVNKRCGVQFRLQRLQSFAVSSSANASGYTYEFGCSNSPCIGVHRTVTRFRTCTTLQQTWLEKVNPDDIVKTAVITPFGLFEYVRMPFGLRNTAQTFQGFMDEVTRGLNFSFVYLDDILVASESPKEHADQLDELFRRFVKYGIKINPAKCVFNASKLDFLGLEISADGIKSLADKVAAIRDMPAPTNLMQLPRFLGCINFYRRFLPNLASTLAPLERLLSAHNHSTRFSFSTLEQRAFQAAKEKLAQATMLTHPRDEAPLAIAKMDAVSLLLSSISTQGNKHWLEGRKFFILADHKPLIYATLSRLSPVDNQGVDNQVADALSWPLRKHSKPTMNCHS
uniref:RNA-directed DNA polymerase n=1 Tax=Trichuris muris TaxID=70415 RepID=A0A5S6QS30_TRIMR